MDTRLDPERWHRVGEILDAALAAAPEQWPAILDAACDGAPELRREVEELLERIDRARGFLAAPPAAAAAAVLAEAQLSADRETGRRIGPYAIVREIGRGGMSRVFLADRADGQFEQRVALKLLRSGLDAEIDRARFRAERQILATLHHPNIAKLLDGGLTGDGQLYLVLEYVEGEPIDVHCDARSLSVEQRIELFLMAADATQYAHRSLVVHRDIKTSNILVGADGAVKLLDFGLAKLLEPGVLARESSGGQASVQWMTPEYAAPEQLRHDPVTTLTDVYQLGVVLYRLLVGRLPFAPQGGHLRDLQAAILRGEPTPPSAVMASLDPGRARVLRGDLDAIVLKALHVEPAERFASVEALANDLRRHRSGHPVIARRSTAAYRARRFIRRNRVQTFAAMSIVVSALASTAFSLRQAHRAAAQRDLAAAASREAQAVTSFVMGLFEASDPEAAKGDTLTAVELVHRAAARAELLAGHPLLQAQMLEVTGRLYRSLGRYSEAYAVVERALAVRRSLGTSDALDAAATRDQLADLALPLGHYAAADSFAKEALSVQQRILGPAHPAIANTLRQLGNAAVYRGELVIAEGYYRKALAVQQTSAGPTDSLTAEGHLTLGAVLRREGRLDDAEHEFRLGLRILETSVGPNSPLTAEAMLKVAYLLDEDRARYAEAEPLYRRALEIRRRTLGDGSPMTAAALLDLASFLSDRGDSRGATAAARQGLEIARRAYGPEHPAVADFTGALAMTYHRAHEFDSAEVAFRRAIAMDRKLRGADHGNIAGLEVGLARVLIDRGQYAAAETVLNDAIRIRERESGPGHPITATTEGLLGMLFTREHRFAAADSILRLALGTMERQVGREHHDVRELYGWRADLEDARGRHAEASRYRALANVK